MNAVKLDAKDWKLLKELDRNCRQSDAEIGRKIGLSQQVVNYRINGLVKSGVIRQFYAVADITKLGYSFYDVFFKLQNLERSAEEEMRQFALTSRNITWAGNCDGAWDMIFTVVAKTPSELDMLLKEFTGRFGRNVLYKTVLLLAEFPQFMLGDKETKVLRFGGDERAIPKLDGLDEKILAILSTNARMPYVEIAQRIKVDVDVVRYRVKKLIDRGVLKGFGVWTDSKLTGRQVYELILCFQGASLQREKALLAFLRQNPNVAYALKTIGNWDMEVDFRVKDNNEFRENVIRLRNNFQDIIRTYETLLVFDEYKMNYYPFRSEK